MKEQKERLMNILFEVLEDCKKPNATAEEKLIIPEVASILESLIFNS